MSFLPPGCRFYPSDEQILTYYLRSKNDSDDENDNNDENTKGYDLIKELELYDYEPFDLPENACYAYGYKGRKRHWYCFTKREGRVLKGEKQRRKAKGGYWRRSGRVREVVGADSKVVIGTRSKFVFYLGNSVKHSIRTDWVLYEYALIHHLKASYVLCRVFVKSRAGNSLSENILSSCAEESVTAVRHIGIQHDGFLTPEIVEVKAHSGNSIDKKNVLPRYPFRPNIKLDDQVIREPTSDASFKLPSGTQCEIDSTKLVRTPGLPGDDMLVDSEASQQLLSILEGDFIELDDLVD